MAGYQSIHSGQTIDSAITEVGNTSNSVTARKSGAGAPTSATVGRVGDLYTDTATGKMYHCTSASSGSYGWEKVGAGDEGIYFTPSVSESGVVSWTNNGGLPNPEAVNISGEDGVSPAASVERISGGVRIAVTDGSGTTSATLNDGTSPSASVEQTEDGAEITVTDASGTTTANLKNGFSIGSIAQTGGGTGSGQTAIYTLYLDDDEEDPTPIDGTLSIYNGRDGTGAGDMTKAEYAGSTAGVVKEAEVAQLLGETSESDIFNALDGFETNFGRVIDGVIEEISSLFNDSGAALDAVDAQRLGGQLPSYYASASSVPSTASDVGADPAGTAASAVSSHDGDDSAHASLFAAKADDVKIVGGKLYVTSGNVLLGSGVTLPEGGGGSAFVPYNVNLLDNSAWFAYVVNQRGNVSYNVTSGTWDSSISGNYTVDRWITHGSITIHAPTASAAGYITMANGAIMKQRMEIVPSALLGKTCCVAVDIGGTVYSGTVQFPSAASGASAAITLGGISAVVGFDGGTYTLCGISNVSGVPYIKLTAGAAVNVRRVWLEFGNVCHMETTPPKNYAENLAACQRFLLDAKLSVFGAGYTNPSGKIAYITIPTPATLRVTPAIGLILGNNADVVVRCDGSNYSAPIDEGTVTATSGGNNVLNIGINMPSNVTMPVNTACGAYFNNVSKLLLVSEL